MDTGFLYRFIGTRGSVFPFEKQKQSSSQTTDLSDALLSLGQWRVSFGVFRRGSKDCLVVNIP